MNDDSLISERYFKKSENVKDDFESTEPSEVQPEVSEGEAIEKIEKVLKNQHMLTFHKVYLIQQIVDDYLLANYEPEIPNDVLNGRY